jgi:hypothetical protein
MDCTALTVVEQPALPAELTATLELAADFAKASKAKATQDAYGSDFRIFDSWCRPRGLRALPATAESVVRLPGGRRLLPVGARRRWAAGWPPFGISTVPRAMTRLQATRR